MSLPARIYPTSVLQDYLVAVGFEQRKQAEQNKERARCASTTTNDWFL
ncbi:hypothetical protein THOB06_10139 [Vibrio rotiferianus]|nr:hypothetical protein THOG10_10139 [Vibrio rotiferianus]CAH1555634.1 hypothetical protein THOB06_10139 [Vibrio rotiferianus]